MESKMEEFAKKFEKVMKQRSFVLVDGKCGFCFRADDYTFYLYNGKIKVDFSFKGYDIGDVEFSKSEGVW